LLKRLDASPTANATLLAEDALPASSLALGIVTPEATQRAAFKKDDRPNASTIVDRLSIYVK
jgi:hypothetical protein